MPCTSLYRVVLIYLYVGCMRKRITLHLLNMVTLADLNFKKSPMSTNCGNINKHKVLIAAHNAEHKAT